MDCVTLPLAVRVFGALGVRLELSAGWRGGELDRLLDERHASLVEAASGVYLRAGWEAHPELTYARFGERGSIDLFAVHSATRVVAVNEMKTSVTSVEELIRRHDAKARLARDICFERFGWRPSIVGRILIIGEDRTARRVVDRHATTFAAAYPARSREIRRWLGSPDQPISGLWFLTLKPRGNGRHGARSDPGGGGARSRSRDRS